MHWILLLFIVVPLVELTLLLVLADVTHWWVSVLLVLVSGLLGSILARRQGLRVFARIRGELRQGTIPTDSVLDAGLIFLAGALLLTPGMLTDAVGLSLLIPFCRRIYRPRIIAWFRRKFSVRTRSDMRSEVIDSYVVERADNEDKNDDDTT